MSESRDLEQWADAKIKRRNESLAKLEAVMGGPPAPEVLEVVMAGFRAEREALEAAAVRAAVGP